MGVHLNPVDAPMSNLFMELECTCVKWIVLYDVTNIDTLRSAIYDLPINVYSYTVCRTVVYVAAQYMWDSRPFF